MSNSKRLNVILWFAAAAMALAPHAGAQNGTPSLDQFVNQHLKALGGQAALAASGALLLRGWCDSTAQDESGPVEVLVRSPKVVLDLIRGGLRMGYSGESVWRSTPAEGLQQRKGRDFAELVTVFDPSRALHWKEWYPQLAVAGVRKTDGRDAVVLETLPGNPRTERLVVDRESALLIRDEVTPQFVFTFSDYRAVKGVMVAFVVREATPNGITYTYRFESVGPAEADDESRFQPK